MSGLSIAVKAGERLLIAGVLIQVSRNTKINVLSPGPILRGPMIMKASEATTPLRNLYLRLQMAYTDPSDISRPLAAKRILAEIESEVTLFSKVGIDTLISEGNYYRALECLWIIIKKVEQPEK